MDLKPYNDELDRLKKRYLMDKWSEEIRSNVERRKKLEEAKSPEEKKRDEEFHKRWSKEHGYCYCDKPEPVQHEFFFRFTCSKCHKRIAIKWI